MRAPGDEFEVHRRRRDISRYNLAQYTRRYSLTANRDVPECVICFDEFKAGNEVTQMPCSSKHVFH